MEVLLNSFLKQLVSRRDQADQGSRYPFPPLEVFSLRRLPKYGPSLLVLDSPASFLSKAKLSNQFLSLNVDLSMISSKFD